MESIKEYGFTNPIIVDADMVIIAGHTRREEVYREVRGVKAELEEKETIIRVLTTHIREKELL